MTVTTLSTMTITVNTPRTVDQLGVFIKDPTDNRGECRTLAHFFDRLKGGLESASFDVQTSATPPTRATNTVTVTFGAMTNGDTVVIAGTTLTAETGTPSGGAQFKMVTSTTVTSANLIACINANTTLNKLMVATGGGSSGVVTLTLYTPGVIGNQVPLVGSTGMVAGAATFTTGAGGIETAPVTFNKGR